MKKFIKFLLIFVLGFSLIGCKDDKTNNSENKEPNNGDVNSDENGNNDQNNNQNNNGSVTPEANPYGASHKGTVDDPFTVADAILVAKATGETATTDTYYIKGVVKSVNTNGAANYGNINVDMTDNGGSEVFIAWQIVNINNEKFTTETATSVKVGDTIVVKGQIVNYKGDTPETVGKGTTCLVSVEAGNGSTVTTPSVSLPSGVSHKGIVDDPFTVADAILVAKATGETATSDAYYIKGVVKSVNTNGAATYGNINVDMVDEGGSEVFIAWQILNINNEKFTTETATSVKVGDTIVVKGCIVNYKNDTPETVGKGASCLVSVEAGNGSVVTTPSFTMPEGVEHAGTYEDPFTVADAILVAQATGETATIDSYYIMGVVSSINTSKVAQYGNVNIDMIDEGGTDVFIAWQINDVDGAAFTEESASLISEGDFIVICGKIVNYKGNTPETVGYGDAELVEVISGEEFVEDPAITAKVAEIATELATLFESEAYEDEFYYYSYYLLLEFEGTIESSTEVLTSLKAKLTDSYTLVNDIVSDTWEDGETGYFMDYSCENGTIAVYFGTYMDTETNKLIVQVEVFYMGEE